MPWRQADVAGTARVASEVGREEQSTHVERREQGSEAH